MKIDRNKVVYNMFYQEDLDKTFLDIVVYNADESRACYHTESWFGEYDDDFKQDHLIDMIVRAVNSAPKDFKLC